MDLETTRLLKRGLPVYTTLSACLLVLTLGAILYLGRDIFVPIALAVLLSFVLSPAVRILQRIAVPQGAAVLVTAVVAFGAIALLIGVVGGQLGGLGADLPKYRSTIKDKIGALSRNSGSGGTIGRALEAFESIENDVRQQLGKQGSVSRLGPSEAPGSKPLPVVVQGGDSPIETLGGVVSPLLHPLTTAGLVLIFVLFVLAAREDLRNRFVRLLGTDDIQHTTLVIDEAARRLSRLLLTQLGINAAFGTVIGVGLWLIGIPSPVLWGILAGILRFVPYVGAVAGAVPPLALALAVDPGWSMLLWTALLFAVVEPIVGQLIEPLLFGHSAGLSPVAVILAATVWTFLWGPIGLVLATPLTVCLVVLGRHIGRLAFIDVMLGDKPALSPPQIFYQRMLAGDPSEAVLQAREFLRERALSTYYDEVALEALRLAHEDVARGRLTPERHDLVRRSVGELIARLGEAVGDPRPRGGRVSAEAEAAVMAAGPDRGASTIVVSPAELRPAWRGPLPVVCLAKPDTLDEIIARILAQVLTKHGIAADVLALEPPQTGQNTRPVAGEVEMVCLSYLEPLSTLHLRHTVRVARKRFPGSGVGLGIWRERDPAMGQTLGHAARADFVAPTIGAALSAIVAAATAEQGENTPGRTRPQGAPMDRAAVSAVSD
jgi:predicted PurR-regulated permease PerM